MRTSSRIPPGACAGVKKSTLEPQSLMSRRTDFRAFWNLEARIELFGNRKENPLQNEKKPGGEQNGITNPTPNRPPLAPSPWHTTGGAERHASVSHAAAGVRGRVRRRSPAGRGCDPRGRARRLLVRGLLLGDPRGGRVSTGKESLGSESGFRGKMRGQGVQGKRRARSHFPIIPHSVFQNGEALNLRRAFRSAWGAPSYGRSDERATNVEHALRRGISRASAFLSLAVTGGAGCGSPAALSILLVLACGRAGARGLRDGARLVAG